MIPFNRDEVLADMDDAPLRAAERALARVDEQDAEIRRLRAVAEAAQKVEEFNAAYPVGTPVRYWKGVREGDGRASRTRSGARVLGGHTAVVWVENEGSCIALSHIEAAR